MGISLGTIEGLSGTYNRDWECTGAFHSGMRSRLAGLVAIDHAPLMRITDEALDEFTGIYKEEFGEEIDRAQAREMASRLVALYERLDRKSDREITLTPPDDPPRRPIGFQA